MIGIVRIYAELLPQVPAPHHPPRPQMFKVIDCEPHMVPDLRRRLKRQGYDIICVPL